MRRLVSGFALALVVAGCGDTSDDAARTDTPPAAAPAATPEPAAALPAASFSGELVRFNPAPGLFRSIREEPSAGCPEVAGDTPGGAVALTRSHESGLRIVKRRADLATLAAQAGFVPQGSRWMLPVTPPRPADHFRSSGWDALYGEWPADTTAGAGGLPQAHLVALFPRQDGCSVVFLLSNGDPADLIELQAALNSVTLVQ